MNAGPSKKFYLCVCGFNGILFLLSPDIARQCTQSGEEQIHNSVLKEVDACEGCVRLPSDCFSSPVMYDECIFVGCRDNCLYCLAYDGWQLAYQGFLWYTMDFWLLSHSLSFTLQGGKKFVSVMSFRVRRCNVAYNNGIIPTLAI